MWETLGSCRRKGSRPGMEQSLAEGIPAATQAGVRREDPALVKHGGGSHQCRANRHRMRPWQRQSTHM